jgi:hypothetical protein
MRKNSWRVVPGDCRPATPPGLCTYCRQPMGAEHAADCVIRVRTVVIRLAVEMVVEVVEDLDVEQIHFRFNESSYCLNNLLDQLSEETEDDGHCICGRADVTYVREATASDHLALVQIDRLRERLLQDDALTQEEADRQRATINAMTGRLR